MNFFLTPPCYKTTDCLFENVVRYIFLKLVNMNAKEIHVGFDNITSPSIKDIERERREEYPKDTPAIPTCYEAKSTEKLSPSIET